MTPFHADLHRPAGTAAGTFPLYDPGTSPACVRYISFSSDTAQRFVVGTDDADGQRFLAGYIGANGGAQRERLLRTQATGGGGHPIVLITTQASAFDVSIDGELE